MEAGDDQDFNAMINKEIQNKEDFESRYSEAQGFSLVELLIVSVILVFTLGVIISVITGAQRSYAFERQRMEALNDASAAMNMFGRLIRNAGNNTGLIPVRADPNGDGVFNDIAIAADWYPEDGLLDDPYENIQFRTNNGVLQKLEPSDGTTWEPYLENVRALTFTYFDANNAVILAPQTNHALIVGVRIQLETTGASPMTFTSFSTIRERRQ